MFFLLFSEDFRPLSGDSGRFSKIIPKAKRTFPNIFRKFWKISEDCRRLSRMTRRCFHHTPMNLSSIQETNLISVKSSISSLVRMWKIRHSSPGCSFAWVVYYPVKHSCLYCKFGTHMRCLPFETKVLIMNINQAIISVLRKSVTRLFQSLMRSHRCQLHSSETKHIIEVFSI